MFKRIRIKDTKEQLLLWIRRYVAEIKAMIFSNEYHQAEIMDKVQILLDTIDLILGGD